MDSGHHARNPYNLHNFCPHNPYKSQSPQIITPINVTSMTLVNRITPNSLITLEANITVTHLVTCPV